MGLRSCDREVASVILLNVERNRAGDRSRLIEEKKISVASNFCRFFFLGLDDDTIAHRGPISPFRIALVLVPGLFVELHVHRQAFGRFDFDMICVDGHNRTEYMLVCAMGEARRRNKETRENHKQA